MFVHGAVHVHMYLQMLRCVHSCVFLLLLHINAFANIRIVLEVPILNFNQSISGKQYYKQY